MTKKITPWFLFEGAAIRTLEGADPEDVKSRVAIVEKTPRVRIRDSMFAETRNSTIDDQGNRTYSIERQWQEFLDWCEGLAGDGPADNASRVWCDNMLRALGYTL